MFNEPGKKIKRIAIGAFIVESIAAFIGGIASMVDGGGAAGLLIMIGGFFAAWVIAIFIYGFGQLVDKTEEIADAQAKKPPRQTVADKLKADNDSIPEGYAAPEQYKMPPELANEDKNRHKKERIQSLYEKGIITEEEYKAAIARI